MSISAEDIQRQYYKDTASEYDDMHMADSNDEHYVSLRYIDLLCERFGMQTLLDVGAGTGRAVRFLRERGRNVRGVEPVTALIERAEEKGIPKDLIVEGTGYSLPFPDKSFDVVFECAVLHHVAQPDRVVQEMMRVATKAIFLSDGNRFGQGRAATRWLKLFLYKTRLWNALKFILTGGKMYTITEGDGLAYSYSVYDSYAQLAEWADTIWVIPTAPDKDRRLAHTWFHPLMTSEHVLLCAFRTTSES